LGLVTRTDVLLQRFEDDRLEDVVWYLLDPTAVDPDDDTIKNSARGYFIHDDQVRRTVSRNHSPLVLPAIEGIFAAKDVHANNGHFGRELVITELLRTCTWPTMRSDVDKAIANCHRCVQFGTRLQRLLLRPVIRVRPFQTIAMDYLAMPKAANGENAMLVAEDLFSKFVIAISIPGPGNTTSTIKMLEIIRKVYRTPEELLTDNGRPFANAAVAAWCASNGTTQTFSAPFAHVGSIENMNHLVLERLRRLCSMDVSDVDSSSGPRSLSHGRNKSATRYTP
jgi:hypothetical protein